MGELKRGLHAIHSPSLRTVDRRLVCHRLLIGFGEIESRVSAKHIEYTQVVRPEPREANALPYARSASNASRRPNPETRGSQVQCIGLLGKNIAVVELVGELAIVFKDHERRPKVGAPEDGKVSLRAPPAGPRHLDTVRKRERQPERIHLPLHERAPIGLVFAVYNEDRYVAQVDGSSCSVCAGVR